jgi:hypothetical protein
MQVADAFQDLGHQIAGHFEPHGQGGLPVPPVDQAKQVAVAELHGEAEVRDLLCNVQKRLVEVLDEVDMLEREEAV